MIWNLKRILPVAVVVLGLAALGTVNHIHAETSPEDLLQIIMQGRREAVKSIQSGKGIVQVRTFRQRNGDGIDVVDTDAKYDVVFFGNKFKYVAETSFNRNESGGSRQIGPYVPGITFTRAASYDGTKAVAYDASGKSAVISTQTGEPQKFANLLNFARPRQGILDVDNVDNMFSPNAIEKRGLRVVRREVLDGDECVVLQISWVTVQSDDARVSFSWDFWVSAGKGFTIPKSQITASGGKFGTGTVMDEWNTEVRDQGDDRWVPVKHTETHYSLGPSSMKPALHWQKTVTFDRDFQFNVPVGEDDLMLTLPSGTEVRDEVLNAEYTVP